MEFGHHHHRRDDDDEDNRFPRPGHQPYDGPPPPRPVQQWQGDEGPEGYYDRPGYAPPPPVQHVSHEVGHGYGNDPPRPYDSGYGEPEYAPAPPVQHVSHEGGSRYGNDPPRPYPDSGYSGEGGFHGQPNRPFPSSGVQHVSHENWEGGALSQQRTVRVFTKANEHFSLSIRDGNVILARANPRDEYQHWIKDMKYSTRVKDEEGLPSFALVNKATGQALKHAIGATHPVRLAPYNPDYLDESLLWTESHDTGEGFRCIRMVNNITLNLDAFHGDEDHGGVREGTTLVLWEWLKGKNQRWKIVPY